MYCFIDGTIDCNVTDVLKFCTGADTIQPCGFYDEFPSISFDFSATLPTVATCQIELRLPSKYVEYEKFKKAMLLAVKGHAGFGAV